MLEKIQETATFLREKMHTSPEPAIILGTGLGSLVHEITDKAGSQIQPIERLPGSSDGYEPMVLTIVILIDDIWYIRILRIFFTKLTDQEFQDRGK